MQVLHMRTWMPKIVSHTRRARGPACAVESAGSNGNVCSLPRKLMTRTGDTTAAVPTPNASSNYTRK